MNTTVMLTLACDPHTEKPGSEGRKPSVMHNQSEKICEETILFTCLDKKNSIVGNTLPWYLKDGFSTTWHNTGVSLAEEICMHLRNVRTVHSMLGNK